MLEVASKSEDLAKVVSSKEKVSAAYQTIVRPGYCCEEALEPLIRVQEFLAFSAEDVRPRVMCGDCSYCLMLSFLREEVERGGSSVV